jgi:hypothetical protein
MIQKNRYFKQQGKILRKESGVSGFETREVDIR